MFRHISLLDSSSVLGDVRFEWLYLSSLIYVCLMAVWELRSGWRNLPRPQNKNLNLDSMLVSTDLDKQAKR